MKTQKQNLEILNHKAWIKGACTALALIAKYHPLLAADALRDMMQPHHLKLAEPYDRRMLRKAISEAWPKNGKAPAGDSVEILAEKLTSARAAFDQAACTVKIAEAREMDNPRSIVLSLERFAARTVFNTACCNLKAARAVCAGACVKDHEANL